MARELKVHYVAPLSMGIHGPQALCGTWWPKNSVGKNRIGDVTCRGCIKLIDKLKASGKLHG